VAKSENQKQKLFRILEILMRKTDEDNGLTINQIISELEYYGITAERKSIYSDFDTLEELGFSVVRLYGNPPTYTLAERIFEMPELKLLVDAIQSSKFITREKSYEMIEKLKLFAGSRSDELTRQVFVKDRVKTENATTLYTIDRIHTAIKEDLRIAFGYFSYNVDKKRYLRHNGKRYNVSPKALIWSNDNYYLVGFDEDAGTIKNFRVDKMHKTQILPVESSITADFYRLEPADYSRKSFGMFGGREELVTLEAKESLASVVLDRFGMQTSFFKTDFGFRFSVRVFVSPTFFAWVMGFGEHMRIIEPLSVREEMKDMIEKIISNYK
jgi:predicted DNA-binding transcriptional regulator YafY